MAMCEVIEAMKRNDFSKCMNPPEPGWDGIADVKIFPDLSQWAVCPFCGKKAIKILPETKMKKVPWKCRNNKCKKSFFINVE